VSFHRIGVVGAGVMGSGIAEVCARAGLDVLVHEIDESRLEGARYRIEGSLNRAVESGKVKAEVHTETLERLTYSTEITDFGDRELVIEAVVESEDEKVQVFSHLDRVLENEDAIIASNTSSIPIMKLAMATGRPQSVIGLHFFNPVPVLRLVEIVTSLLTDETTTTRSEKFVTDVLDKHVIRSKDRAGFIVNALLIPYILSSIRMFESGFATREDIDKGMVEGCRHPMGPLALADLIGLDTLMAVAESLYEEFKEPLYAPPPLLCRIVEAGLMGRKSERGFYEYA
jgi:3-hydroxybutyryl-CoA dehydrogenase